MNHTVTTIKAHVESILIAFKKPTAMKRILESIKKFNKKVLKILKNSFILASNE